MRGKERREEILKLLSESKIPLSGLSLAKQTNVSRQVIVQDIALLRAEGKDIISTNQGYLLQTREDVYRVYKVQHSNQEVREELELIVDCGGMVKDVFVSHKLYGVLRADINIKSRLDIDEFVEEIESGKSSLLLNVTSGYHYHTVYAENEKILNIIQEKLEKRGFLAKLQDYEPVNFRAEDNK